MHCINCGTSITENTTYCEACDLSKGQSQMTQQPIYQYQQPTQETDLGMKWFKFLIYFSLFFSALISLVNGYKFLTGSIYESVGLSANIVYSTSNNLKVVNIFIGFFLIGYAIFILIIRQKLAHYKKVGIKLLYSLFILEIILIIIIAMISSIIMRNLTIIGSVVFQLIMRSAVIHLQIVYFNKRKHLFH